LETEDNYQDLLEEYKEGTASLANVTLDKQEFMKISTFKDMKIMTRDFRNSTDSVSELKSPHHP